MGFESLAIALLVYLMVVVAIVALRTFRRRGMCWTPLLLATLAALVAVTYLWQTISSGDSLLRLLLEKIRSREPRSILAAGFGAVLALPWLLLSVSPRLPADDRGGVRRWLGPLLLVIPVVGVTAAGSILVLDAAHLLTSRGRINRAIDSRFILRTVTTFENDPVRVTVDPRGRVIVSVNNVFQGFSDGALIEVKSDPKTGRASQQVLASSAALFRPYGLTTRGDDAFVSRSGVFAKADRGRIEFAETGAVTRLSDLNGDGLYDYLDDVVRGLPGARDSHTQHSNNGLEFGPDGALYVAVGVSTDKQPGSHPYEGTILRADLDKGTVEVFARGLRNPFDLGFGPDGQLFAIDQDTNGGIGDKFLHVRRGDHFGHPYVRPEMKTHAESFTPAIALSAPNQTYTAMAYTGANPNLPAEYRNGFFVADWASDQVVFLTLAREGDSYRVASRTVFADVADPTDIAVAPDGGVYVLSYFGRRLSCISPRNR